MAVNLLPPTWRIRRLERKKQIRLLRTQNLSVSLQKEKGTAGEVAMETPKKE